MTIEEIKEEQTSIANGFDENADLIVAVLECALQLARIAEILRPDPVV